MCIRDRFDTNPAQEKPADLLPKFQYGDLEGLNRYIQQMRESGFLVCYNHAYWSLQDWRDYSGLKGLFAMEIYNHGCEPVSYTHLPFRPNTQAGCCIQASVGGGFPPYSPGGKGPF